MRRPPGAGLVGVADPPVRAEGTSDADHVADRRAAQGVGDRAHVADGVLAADRRRAGALLTEMAASPTPNAVSMLNCPERNAMGAAGDGGERRASSRRRSRRGGPTTR